MARRSRTQRPAGCPVCGNGGAEETIDQTTREDGVVVTGLTKRCSNGHMLSRRALEFSDGHMDRSNYIAGDGTPRYVEPDGWSTPADFD